jgi:stearoyl-CoA desaturase (Delta-9 desaturase)
MNILKNWFSVPAISFVIMHFIGIIGPFILGFSTEAVFVAIFLYAIRMFFVTGFAHRYFSHNSFKINYGNKFFETLMAFLFTTCIQKGAVWWASHHRHHHKHSDTEHDVHSRKRFRSFVKGIVWSHIGWIMVDEFQHINDPLVKDHVKKEHLMWFEKNNNHMIGGLVLGIVCFCFGAVLESGGYDSVFLNGMQMVVVGMFMSTIFLYHGTFAINSLAHWIGNKPNDTGDDSRNSLLLALITLGEGWHNNHHDRQVVMWQGRGWQKVFDWTGIILWLLSKTKLITLRLN